MSVLVAVHASIDNRLENVHEVAALVAVDGNGDNRRLLATESETSCYHLSRDGVRMVVVDRPKRREIDTAVGISDDM